MNNKRYPLSLNGETFSAFKADFDSMLRQLLTEMEKWEAEEATISVKMTVKLEQDQARDFLANGYDGMRDITKPTFKHDISTVMQAKSKKSGSMGGDMELVWDKDTCQYIMRNIDNGQVTLFDDDVKEIIDADYQDVPALPEGTGEQDAAEEDTETPFGWLCQFIGENLRVTEAMSNYTVRTEGNAVVLSSATSPDSPFYCPAEKLAPHVGHQVVCAGYGQDSIVNVSIECEDCSQVLYDLDAPVNDVNENDETPLTEEESAEAMDAAADIVDSFEDNKEDADEEAGGYDYDSPEEE